MFRSNSGAFVADDVSAHVARTGAQGFGCIAQGLLALFVPAFIIEVFIRQRMGWVYVLISTIWTTLFLVGLALILKVQVTGDQSAGVVVLIPLVWLMSLCQCIALLFTREPVHSSSCGVPHALWRLVFGRSPWAMQFVFVFLEAPLAAAIGFVILLLGEPTGAIIIMFSFVLFIKNLFAFFAWLWRRQMHTDSRIAADAMQSLGRESAQAGDRAPSKPQVVRLTPPPR